MSEAVTTTIMSIDVCDGSQTNLLSELDDFDILCLQISHDDPTRALTNLGRVMHSLSPSARLFRNADDRIASVIEAHESVAD